MEYGRAAQAQQTGRDLKFNLGGTSSPFELALEFGSCESLLLRVSRTGRVERLDIGYVPQVPTRY
jgi:hypothetical protein